jgi:CubicO group peptidase (beta-lactamase class C family)
MKRLHKILSSTSDWAYKELRSALQNGKLKGVASIYLLQNDKCLFNHNADHTIRPVKSISKTVIGLLVGIALDTYNSAHKSAPVSIDTPLSGLLREEDCKELTGHPLLATSLKAVLTMTTGLDWNESRKRYGDSANDISAFYKLENPLTHLATKTICPEEVGRFNYNGGLTYLLAKVIHFLTGHPAEIVCQTTLFDKLNITSAVWLKPSDKSANIAYSGGLNISAPDLSEIGKLILNEGRYKGEQLVPQDWIKSMFTPHVPQSDLNEAFPTFSGFGMHAWRYDIPVNDGKTLEIWMASGTGGQKLFVIPSIKVVCVIQAENFDQKMQENGLTEKEQKVLVKQSSIILKNFILPALGITIEKR